MTEELTTKGMAAPLMDRHYGQTNNGLYAIKLNPKSTTPNFNAVWQWGIVSLLSSQFNEMYQILSYEVPRPGVNVFRPKEVTMRVLTSGLQGFAIGCVFGLTQQLTLGIRGKNDPVNSGVAGAVVGTLIASRQVNPWRCNMYPIFFGLPAFMVHYGYTKWWDSEYDRAIQLNKTLKEVMPH